MREPKKNVVCFFFEQQWSIETVAVSFVAERQTHTQQNCTGKCRFISNFARSNNGFNQKASKWSDEIWCGCVARTLSRTEQCLCKNQNGIIIIIIPAGHIMHHRQSSCRRMCIYTKSINLIFNFENVQNECRGSPLSPRSRIDDIDRRWAEHTHTHTHMRGFRGNRTQHVPTIEMVFDRPGRQEWMPLGSQQQTTESKRWSLNGRRRLQYVSVSIEKFSFLLRHTRQMSIATVSMRCAQSPSGGRSCKEGPIEFTTRFSHLKCFIDVLHCEIRYIQAAFIRCRMRINTWPTKCCANKKKKTLFHFTSCWFAQQRCFFPIAVCFLFPARPIHLTQCSNLFLIFRSQTEALPLFIGSQQHTNCIHCVLKTLMLAARSDGKRFTVWRFCFFFFFLPSLRGEFLFAAHLFFLNTGRNYSVIVIIKFTLDLF